MVCKICGTETKFLFKTKVLNKYQVSYYVCPNCDFIQTEKPYWLGEAYNSAITELDTGLVSRNVAYAGIFEPILKNSFDYLGTFLDYAGGYGLLVRLMRDRGFDFYWEDKFCANLFAKNFSLENLDGKAKFEAVTALEAFEHFVDPLKEIENMLEKSETIIFSTELHPEGISKASDWWYFTAETGQHIAFYSGKTFYYVAKKYKLNYFTKNELHILTHKKFKTNPLETSSTKGKTSVELKSLREVDYELAKTIVHGAKLVSEATKPDKQGILEKLIVANSKLKISEDELKLAKLKEITAEESLKSAEEELGNTKKELAGTKDQLSQINNELLGIYASRSWRLVTHLQKTAKKLLPVGSLRRKCARVIFKTVRKVVKAFAVVSGAVVEAGLYVKRILLKIKPRKKRNINKDSKKVVYIGHSYHNKTKSTAFLIDYIKEYYDVEVVLDESWLGDGTPYPDLSFIDESYLAVIFFQNLPNKQIVKDIKNENIIYFPMYDAVSGLGYNFWRDYAGIKIMNFSKTLHERFLKWGFESAYVQFFPELSKFIPGDKDEVFFWQRITSINIDVVSKLLSREHLKIHMHKSIDPGQQFIQPSKEQEKKYSITYSEWFKTREEMWETIEKKGIFIAPRAAEGIGMSFLEAMAMGKAVIAVNNPTMNEYIKNNETGYLYDMENPQKIDLSKIEEVQKRSYEYMCKGHENWEKDIHKIIDFMLKK